jgi:hypothetical protein
MARGKRTRLRSIPSSSPPQRPVPRGIVRGGHTPKDPPSEEEFNLDDLSASDGKEETGGHAPPPRSRSPASIEPTAGSSVAPTRATSPELLAPPPPKRTRKVPDIAFFFDKSDGIITICKPCKCVTTFCRLRSLLTDFRLGSVLNPTPP